jgi:hypothetical protein
MVLLGLILHIVDLPIIGFSLLLWTGLFQELLDIEGRIFQKPLDAEDLGLTTSAPILVPWIQSKSPQGAKFPLPPPLLCRSCLRVMPPNIIPGIVAYPERVKVSSRVIMARRRR